MDEIIIYPPLPDTARIQFLTSINNSLNITGKRSAFIRFIFGKDKVKLIGKPYGIHIKNGKIYICDTGLGGLEIMDLENSTFDYFTPSGFGKLNSPINCFVDESDFLYVADAGRRQIVVFDNTGKYISAFGEAENFKPTDVFVYDNKIWVANIKNNRINVYSRDSVHKLLYYFPEAEKGAEEFIYSPVNIYVTDDKVYVSDIGDAKIKIYTHDGKYLQSVGSYGKAFGQFVRNKGIAVDRESNLFVVDAGFGNVQIFNKEGKLLMFLGETQGPGGMCLPAKITIDYDNLKYFQKYVHQSFNLKYLILVTSQYGPNKINIYGAVEARQPKEEVKEDDTNSKEKKEKKKKRNKGLEQGKKDN